MALKKIEISGFKSFAERIVISFVDGINAIVGPNGCGKSNIVDGFLWALGQQSAKSLRASSMQDVIFAGSEKRKPQNFAEVTVVLSNEKGILPVDYQEVAITRRLYRDGESEYLINKKAVRLKDIVELLAHTGVGKEAFAVIGQGQVVEIINQSAQDRRSLFDEVAGISHFLLKRKESERKLEHAKLDLSRARDIAREVEAQEKVLEKQAQEAKRYQEVREKLACLERHLLSVRHQETKAARAKLADQLQAVQQSLDTKLEAETSVKTLKVENAEAIKAWRAQCAEKQKTVHTQQGLKATSEKDISFCDEKREALLQQEKESQKQTGSFQESQTRLLSDIAEKEKLIVKIDEERKTKEALKNESYQEWHSVQSQGELAEKNLKAFYARRFSLQTRLQSLEAEVRKSQLAEEVALEKLLERKNQKLKLKERQERAQGELETRQSELKQHVERVDEFKKLLEEKNARQREKSAQLDQEKEKRNRLQQELFEKSAKVKALSALKSNYEGFTSGAKVLLKEASLAGKIYPIAEVLTVEHELLFRLYDSTLVVKSLQDLQLVLDFCEKQKCQDVSLICLEMLGLKGFEELKEHLVEHVSDIESFKEVKSVLKSIFWVQKKYYIDSLGALHINRQKGESLFTRSKALKTLEVEVEELTRALRAFDEALKVLHDERAAILSEVQKIDQEMRRADMQVVSSNFQLQAIEKEKTQAEQDFVRQEGEMAHLNELVMKLQKDREAKEKEREPCQNELKELERAFQECERDTKNIQTRLALLADVKQKAFFAFDEALKRHEKEKHALELLQLSKKEQESRLNQELKLKKTIEAELALIEKKRAEQTVLLKAQTETLSTLEAEFKAVVAQGEKLEEEAKKLELDVDRIQTEKEETLKVSSSQQVSLTHLSEQLTALETALNEPPPEGYENFKPASTQASQIETELTRTRNSFERMRNVNLLAVEEYEETHQRHILLQAQLKDLEEAANELLQIVSDLERESRKAFNKTFEEVRLAFKKHFQTLFQGGEADLVLLSGESGPSGVEIMAKPPGKQMRSMQLLSGGEKSLTAVALLFSCFEVRPSPFCILDEVDAPLDESNVERLGNLIRQFCEKTQFLVITHNKKTMNMSDTLIGVSMAEKGVSQIISLDFRRRESEQLALKVN